MKILVCLAFIACASAYQVVYDQQVVYEPGQQITYETQPQQIIYEGQPQVIVQPSQVVYEQQPQVVYQPSQVVVQPPQQVYVQPAVQAKNCPIACPYGWNKFGPFTRNCYLMPSQPLKLDTFWNSVNYCRSKEPTSYPMVINDLVEQALATGVALQYAPSYALALSNAHVWFGVYFDDRTGNWTSLDPATKPSELGMIIGKVSSAVGGNRGMCMSGEPKALGAWLVKPCSDDTGTAWCEMAPRPVCDGRTGGLLPIAPIDLSKPQNLIPKMPSIPIIGQLLGGGSLLGGL